jgi:hypothetical protein
MLRGVVSVFAVVASLRAQTVEVPTFVIGGPTFGEHVGEVEVAAAPDGSFLVLWGDYDQGSGGVDAKDHAGRRHHKSRKLTEHPIIRPWPDAFAPFSRLARGTQRPIPACPTRSWSSGQPSRPNGSAARLPPTDGSGGGRSRRAEIQPGT